jgi:hypothetical protein
MAGVDALATVIALTNRVRVMAGRTVEVTSLQEDNEPVPRTVNAGKIKNLTDRSLRITHYR